MIVPNKFIPFDDSVLAKLPAILERKPSSIGVRELYRAVESTFDGVDQFLLAIDVLRRPPAFE
jgi:hypothetical protein